MHRTAAARPRSASPASRTRLAMLALGCALLLAMPLGAVPVADAETVAPYERAIDISFPTTAEARFSHDYHAPRGGGTRVHKSTDLIGEKFWPLYAAVSGTVCYVNGVDAPKPSWGYGLSICGDDGRRYNYIHINDDHPGTTDASAPHQYAYAPAIHRGARVERGQFVGWMGDSGNAKGIVDHLHFEIVDPRITDPYGTNHVDPYRSLVAALERGDVPDGRPSLRQGCPEAGGYRTSPYQDTSGSPHEREIACVTAWDIAHGKSADVFAPDERLNRGQMSSFLVRTMERAGVTFPGDAELQRRGITFNDIDATTHESTIRRIAWAGVTRGYVDGSFRPHERLSREQIATFVANTYAYVAGRELPAPRDAFVDDDGRTHETSINALAAARIVEAVDAGRFAPRRDVRREHMADLLARLVDRFTQEGLASPPR